uniref:Uncharacterized protein n=1 Tax=viral metagenome TaxID=1070528 RepID=A0A6C0IYT3_9ZZZZ
MVNIHITQEDKEKFKSKNAIVRIRNFLKNNPDVGLVSAVEYLNEGHDFDFKEEGDNIHIGIKKMEYIWGDIQTKPAMPEFSVPFLKPTNEGTAADKLKNRRKELHAIRTGKTFRDMKTMKKSVDRGIVERYTWLRQNLSKMEIPLPLDMINTPEKYKDQIQLFSSGFIKITGDAKVDNIIYELFKLIADEVDYTPLTMQQVQERLAQQQPQQAPPAPPQDFDLPSNINLSNYVDSDTESDSDEEA